MLFELPLVEPLPDVPLEPLPVSPDVPLAPPLPLDPVVLPEPVVDAPWLPLELLPELSLVPELPRVPRPELPVVPPPMPPPLPLVPWLPLLAVVPDPAMLLPCPLIDDPPDEPLCERLLRHELNSSENFLKRSWRHAR